MTSFYGLNFTGVLGQKMAFVKWLGVELFC